MKILISVDIEGIAGVFHPEQTRPGNGEYETARRLMTQEANAAIEGALDAGAGEIIVNDSHGGFRNLLPDMLHPAARITFGKPRYLSMMSADHPTDLSGVDAALLVGYHARAQTRGVLAHTMNGFAFANVWINQQLMSEAVMNGAQAGEFGVPIAFCSGDDVFIDETRPYFPKAIFVETKKAHGNHSGTSLSPQKSRDKIREGVRRALLRLDEMTPFKLDSPCTCRIQTNSPALADLFCLLPFMKRVDGVQIEFDGPDILYIHRIINSLSAMSFMLR